jgi:LssY-like putative type I secretion system component LssY
MLRFFLRSLWRLVILLIGVGLVWAVVRIYPYAEARLPAFFVLLLIYIFFAYLGIPLLVRLLHIFIKPNRIPLYVTTGDGWPSDPVNIAIIATGRKQLVAAMQKAGWYVADPITYQNGLRVVTSILFNTPYPTAPLSNLYLFNRPHDVGFEISTNKNRSARTRHHVRFWRLEEPVVQHDGTHHHYTFWAKKLRHLIVPEKEMWIGAATEETHAIDIQWRTGQLTHGGSHDSDKERDFIIESLQKTKAVSKVHLSQPGETIKFRGQQIRTFYVSNGSIKIARLR